MIGHSAPLLTLVKRHAGGTQDATDTLAQHAQSFGRVAVADVEMLVHLRMEFSSAGCIHHATAHSCVPTADLASAECVSLHTARVS